MSLAKASITLPEDIYLEAKKLSNNFSLFVAESLKEMIKKKHLERAIASFSSWKNVEGNSVDIVNDLRKEGDRKYADCDY